jgi:hypothetical protein
LGLPWRCLVVTLFSRELLGGVLSEAVWLRARSRSETTAEETCNDAETGHGKQMQQQSWRRYVCMNCGEWSATRMLKEESEGSQLVYVSVGDELQQAIIFSRKPPPMAGVDVTAWPHFPNRLAALAVRVEHFIARGSAQRRSLAFLQLCISRIRSWLCSAYAVDISLSLVSFVSMASNPPAFDPETADNLEDVGDRVWLSQQSPL